MNSKNLYVCIFNEFNGFGDKCKTLNGNLYFIRAENYISATKNALSHYKPDHNFDNIWKEIIKIDKEDFPLKIVKVKYNCCPTCNADLFFWAIFKNGDKDLYNEFVLPYKNDESLMMNIIFNSYSEIKYSEYYISS